MRIIRLTALEADALRFIARHRLIVRIGQEFRALSAPADAPGLPPELIYRLRAKRLIDRVAVEGAFTVSGAGERWIKAHPVRRTAA